MHKDAVIKFFDEQAPTWDERTVRNEKAINEILDKGGIKKGVRVLDVACGTGVLFNDYLKRDVSCVVGVDISPEMIKRARENYKDSRIEVICDDVHNLKPDKKFDCIIVHNAFPHFFNPGKLIEHLSVLLFPGGRLTVAHSISRRQIENCHSGNARTVSVPLMEAEELAELMKPYFLTDTVISDDEKYIVSGTLY